MSRIVAGIYSGYGRNDMKMIRTYDNEGKQSGWLAVKEIVQLYVYSGRNGGYKPAAVCRYQEGTYYLRPPAPNYNTALRRLNRVAKKINGASI